MLDLFKKTTRSQFQASLAMLKNGLDQCPIEAWSTKVVNREINQVAFHTLFFTDLYLEKGMGTIENQDFHQEHQLVFQGYRELNDGKNDQTYHRIFIGSYLDFVSEKIDRILGHETSESLAEPVGFPWLEIVRAELYTYNIRHLHHHAAQISARLRNDFAIDVPWVKNVDPA